MTHRQPSKGHRLLLEDRLLRNFLDKVAAATGMSPPSLYAVFGNKHALYLEALARYWDISLAATREALAGTIRWTKR